MKYMPTWYCTNIYKLNLDVLKDKGIKYIFTDLDNTLAPFNIPTPDEKVVKLIENFKKENFKVIIVSNNNGKRVQLFAKGLNIEYISGAKKPFTFVIKRYLKENNIDINEFVLIGDQIMTDIKCANKLKCKSILTNPLSKQESIVTFINRRLDLHYRKKYKIIDTCENIDRSEV